MTLRLSQAPPQYDPTDQNLVRSKLEEVLAYLFRNNASLVNSVALVQATPKGEVSFSIGASNVVTLRVTPAEDTTLSFGYIVGTAGFNMDRDAQTLRNFADSDTPFDQSLGTVDPGDSLWVSVWFYSAADGLGEVSPPTFRKFDADLLEGSVDFDSFASGIKPPKVVDVLPLNGDETPLVFLTTDGKLYRWNGTAWTVEVEASDIIGELIASQIADAAITTAKFAAGIRPVRIVDVLPGAGDVEGDVVYLTTDNKLYRWDGAAWTAAVPTTDLTGTISTAQLANGAVTTVKLGDSQVTETKLSTGSVTEAKIGESAVTETKIGASAVTEAKIGDAAVVTAKLGDSAVTTLKIGDLAITTDKLIDSAVESAKVANYAIGNKKIDGFARSQHGVFMETFEELPSDWTSQYGLGTQSLVSGVGEAGGKVLQSIGMCGIVFPQNIPFDETKLYRMRTRVRMTAAPADPLKDNFYCGVNGYSASGVYNTTHWVCALAKNMGSFTLNEWQEFTGWFQGHGVVTANSSPTSPSGLNATTAYFRPIFLLNYNGGDGTMQIDYIAIDVFDEDGLVRTYLGLNVDGVVAADKVVSDSILAGAVITAKIAAGAVTANEIAANTITANQIAASTITGGRIAALTITGGNIAAATISSDKLVANSITAGQIAAGAVSTDELAALAVTAAKIAAGTITANEIAALTITGAKIAAGTISADKLVANSITAGQIAAGAIGADEIAANIITATHLASNRLSSLSDPSNKYIDFSADGVGEFFIKHPALSVMGDGTALFSGDISLIDDSNSVDFYTDFFNPDEHVGSLEAFALGSPANFKGVSIIARSLGVESTRLVVHSAGMHFDSDVIFDGDLNVGGNLTVSGTINGFATEAWVTSNFVNVTGDTMTGTLTINGHLDVSGSTANSVIIASTGKLRLDGSAAGDTFISEPFANGISFTTGGVIASRLSAAGIEIEATKKLYFDFATSDTFLSEVSANILEIVTGAAQVMTIQNGLVSILGSDLMIASTKKLRLDGSPGGDTSIYQGSDNVIYFERGGGTLILMEPTLMRPTASGVVSLGSASDRWNGVYAATIDLSGYATFGDGVSIAQRLDLVGSPTDGRRQMLIGNTSVFGSFGARYSSGSMVWASNAYQNSPGTDSWNTSLTGFFSSLLELNYNGGLSLYSRESTTATTDTFANFWGGAKFSVSTAGVVIALGTMTAADFILA